MEIQNLIEVIDDTKELENFKNSLGEKRYNETIKLYEYLSNYDEDYDDILTEENIYICISEDQMKLFSGNF